ncbi:MAG: hypothetical protein F6K31_26705 [Symploca sp. SIO2G7]|nr:hypothetical protein [Symploca sp. SIO2G7]
MSDRNFIPNSSPTAQNPDFFNKSGFLNAGKLVLLAILRDRAMDKCDRSL